MSSDESEAREKTIEATLTFKSDASWLIAES